MTRHLLMGFAVPLLLACAPQEPAQPVDVIIFAGQSNMVGSARIENAPDGLFPLPATIELHDFSRSSKFQRTSGRFGPEASFAAALAEAASA